MTRPESTPVIAGVIAAEHDPPGIAREHWLTLIEERVALRSLDVEGAAEIVSRDRVIGRISCASATYILLHDSTSHELAVSAS